MSFKDFSAAQIVESSRNFPSIRSSSTSEATSFRPIGKTFRKVDSSRCFPKIVGGQIVGSGNGEERRLGGVLNKSEGKLQSRGVIDMI